MHQITKSLLHLPWAWSSSHCLMTLVGVIKVYKVFFRATLEVPSFTWSSRTASDLGSIRISLPFYILNMKAIIIASGYSYPGAKEYYCDYFSVPLSLSRFWLTRNILLKDLSCYRSLYLPCWTICGYRLTFICPASNLLQKRSKSSPPSPFPNIQHLWVLYLMSQCQIGTDTEL